MRETLWNGTHSVFASPRHDALPPLEIAKTIVPPGVPPEAEVRPPRTVIWPPVGNFSGLARWIVTASSLAP